MDMIMLMKWKKRCMIPVLFIVLSIAGCNDRGQVMDGDGLTVDMHDYGGFEKVGELPWKLPTNDEEITTKPGDIILYQGNKITIYYGENTWNFTKLGELSGGTEEDIEEWKEVFGGDEDITAEFMVEWTE